jgi:hypothetical protein
MVTVTFRVVPRAGKEVSSERRTENVTFGLPESILLLSGRRPGRPVTGTRPWPKHNPGEERGSTNQDMDSELRRQP